MGELSVSLSKTQKEALIDGDFSPMEVVEIIVTRQHTRFSEDISRPPLRRRTKERVQPASKPPSEKYCKDYSEYKAGSRAADSRSVLGCYFTLYLEHFGEEDPEWCGVKCVKPLYNINQMAHAVCKGDFSELIKFLETIIPLWAKRLRNGSSFPSTRPSIDTLFVRRKIWAQRFLLERQWTN